MDMQRGFRTGIWEIYPLQGEICTDGRAIHLEPKVMEVLVVLAGQAQSVVPRDELADRVWGARAAISDEPLTRCIAQLRQALGDSARDPEYIQTVPKRGYRLLKPVLPLAAPAQAQADPPGDESRTRPASGKERSVWTSVAFTVAAVALLVFGLSYWQRDEGDPLSDGLAATSPDVDARSETVRIAVFPLAHAAEKSNYEPLAEGLVDDIVQVLRGLDDLDALDGIAIDIVEMSYVSESGAKDPIDIVPSDVGYVFSGTVSPDGQIDARIRSVLEGLEEWADTYTQAFENIDGESALLTDVCNEIAGLIGPSIETFNYCRTIDPRGTQYLEALTALRLGRFAMDQRTQVGLLEAITHLRQAMRLDPLYIEACLELARAHVLLPTYGGLVTHDEAYAEAVVVLDECEPRMPSIARYRRGIEAIIHYHNKEYAEAQAAFEDALELTQFRDAELMQTYSHLLTDVGQMSKATDIVQQAYILKQSPVINARFGYLEMFRGNYTRAQQFLDTATQLGFSERAYAGANALVKIKLGQYDEAGAELRNLLRIDRSLTGWIDPFIDWFKERDPIVAEVKKAAAIRALREVEDKRWQGIEDLLLGAWLLLGIIDERDDAYARYGAIETALSLAAGSEGFNVEFLFWKEAAPLRQHPEFIGVLREIGVIAYWDEHDWENDYCHMEGGRLDCI